MNIFKGIAICLLIVTGVTAAWAGNPDRVGQAGATELLINPWPRSSGWHGANTPGILGVEAMRFNVAGITGINKTEFMFSRMNYLQNSGLFFNSFGFVQKVGSANASALGVSIMTLDAGDIEITTADMPEGGLGTFSPRFVNIGVAYARDFSDQIKAGALFRVVSEGIEDVNATGVAIDAGIQYHADITGNDEDRTKFGISIRNVGTPMKFQGNGLTRRAQLEESDYFQTITNRSNQFELPSLLNIGLSQDFYLDGKSDDTTAADEPVIRTHKLTTAVNFTSNSFTRDEFQVGLQYGFKDFVQVRVGMLYQDDIFDDNSASTVYMGPSAGFSFNVPFGQANDEGYRKSFGVDYSYRGTTTYAGIHTFGARLNL